MKFLLQDIWISGIDWDEELLCNLKSEWIELCSGIPELKSVLIPRRRNDVKDSHLHANEIEQAQLHWIRKTQHEFHSYEILALEKQQPIRQDSEIGSLAPILDSQDIL
ncbi:hypothetical protein TNCT_406271 [Trichonephila clavata]|uniref:Uncharacterized protein n=1 Tax=Trichonephila clavata TaxID=2740835 RepID=A0A8X6IE56_TRICU|nr:hypothetical protein TNCT_406271 [Trichonephila clavata]